MRHRDPRPTRWLLPLLTTLAVAHGLPGVSTPRPAAGAGAGAGAEPADDDRERAVMERFLAILERAPRRGTALDRVYGYHVERGSLDALIRRYQERTARDPKDGAAWLLLGLFESQRGRDAAAVSALRRAEDARPDDALPPYYLGQALVLVGQPDEAAAAFERALGRKPARADLLEIFQALGRVYQRAQRNEQALAVWKRLEGLFPGDARVQEQIASTLAEESQLEPALSRYEALAGSVRDPYRKVQFRIEAADLKVRLGRQADALRDFESLLGGLNPDSWLTREVRRRIEEVFLRNDDQAGLARYYERRVETTPDDVEAMARLGRALAGLGRAAEARGRFERAVKLAPSRKELRLALLEQLAREGKFAEADAQYREIDRNEPGNPDVLRDWGRLLLRDTSRPEPDRRSAAAAVWRRLIEARPKDAATAAQIADLFHQAGMADEAIASFKKAVELAPEAAQYREYLGEYYHALKRPDDAMAAWRAIADGPNRNAKNLSRLAEVFAGFGYRAEAVAPLSDAVALDPDAFDPRLRLAELLVGLRRFDEADAQLDAAERLADDDAQREDALNRRIAADQAADRLPARVAALKAEVAGAKAGDAPAWRRLALYLEAARQLPDAVAAAEKALAIDGGSIPSLAVAARLYEAAGRFADAADADRKLATVDRRARTAYLTNVAKLEGRLGRREAALQAGRELLAAAPGNPEHVDFFADLCFQLGANDEGLEALRRAARANANDPAALKNLADALAREFRTEEAIELYWRVFDRVNDLDGKLDVVSRLAELYLQRNQFDRLLARLERFQGEEGRQREGTFCLARAHAAAGDFGTARGDLENLLAASPRDTALLKQLSELAENEGDLAAAVKFQKQLDAVSPGGETAHRLVQLALRAGDLDEAEGVWSRLGESDRDVARTLQAIDGLIGHGKFDTALAITGRLLRKDPGNWEALFREGHALWGLGRPAEAARRFQALLDLRRDDEEVGAIVLQTRRKGGPTTSASTTAPSLAMLERTGARFLLNAATYARSLSGLDYGPGGGINWSPPDFGQARLTALAFLFAQARRENAADAFLSRLRQARDRVPVDPRPLWDWFYLALVRNEYRESYETANALVRVAGHNPSSDFALLYAMLFRETAPGLFASRRAVANVGSGDDPAEEGKPALPADDLDRIRDAFLTLAVARPAWIPERITDAVLLELKRGGRGEELDAFSRQLSGKTTELHAIAIAAALAAESGDLSTLRKLSDAFQQIPAAARLNVVLGRPYMVITPAGAVQIPAPFMARAMRLRADAKAYTEILAAIDDAMARLRGPRRVAERARSEKSRKIQPIRISYPVFVTKKIRNMQAIDYPKPGLYFDPGAILLLRNAFEVFKRDDLLSDLLAHVRRQATADEAAGDSTAALYANLELSALLWWADEKDEAVRALERAAALAPGDVDLRLTMAELRAQRREPEEALAVVDSVEAVDQDVTRRRELLALQLAVQTGRVERARRAAERLFGLRLDSEVQVQLAAQMDQLGMHAMSEAILARARRRVGNNVDSLVALMAQYERQGRADAAVQVAFQILRRPPHPSYSNPGDEDPWQRQALQVLVRSGKLDGIIDRLEAQLRESPHSLQLQQSLVTYYRAAGRTAKLKALSESMASLRPDDNRLRIQLALQLLQSGDTAAALGQFEAVLKKEPYLYEYYRFEIQNAFQQKNKLEDLAALFSRLDLKSFGSPDVTLSLILVLLKDPKTFDRGMDLWGKFRETYPDGLISWMTSLAPVPEFWKSPGTYEDAKRALIPQADARRVEPWAGMETAVGMTAEGRRPSVMMRLLETAAANGTLEGLGAEVESACSRFPRWYAGKAFRGLIRIRQGRFDDGKRILQALLDDPAVRPDYLALESIGQELFDVPEVLPLATAVFERSSKNDFFWGISILGYRTSNARRLATLYGRAGRAAEARRLALRAAAYYRGLVGASDVTPNYTIRKLYSLNAIGDTLLDSGAPADALRIFAEVQDATEELNASRGSIYGDPVARVRDAREGAERASHAPSKETAAATVRLLLSPTPLSVDNDRSAHFDLATVVYPREVDRAAVTSLYPRALELAVDDPGLQAEVRSAVDARLKDHPDDLAARTTSALLDCAGGDPAAIAEAAGRLEREVSEKPLEAISEGARPNARQRAEAAPRLALWLVARACWPHDAAREIGDRLAAIALEAARRQEDYSWALAMLRELGQRAWDRGDRASAEARWASMLELVQSGPASPKASTPTAPAPTRPRAGAAPARGAGGGALAVTPERFDQAAEIARLAADHGLFALSSRALAGSLRGGPPVAALNLTTGVRARAASQLAAGGPPPPSPEEDVADRLDELEGLWRSNGVDDVAVYEALRDIVLPASRPGEVFLYPASVAGAVVSGPDASPPFPPTPRSVGAALARRAVASGRADDLRGRIDERRAHPKAETPSLVLLSLLDQAEGTPGPVAASLGAIDRQLQKETIQASAELACHAALPALGSSDPAAFRAASSVVASTSRALATGTVEETAIALLVTLARSRFARGDAPEGRKRIEEALDIAERITSRSVVDDAPERRGRAFAAAASEYLRAGLTFEALDPLGRVADLPGDRASSPPLGLALAALARRRDDRPAAERYGQLKAWTLHTPDRRQVRILAAVVPVDGATPAESGETKVVDTASILIDSARDAGALDALADEVRALAGRDVENARALLALVEIARGRGESAAPFARDLAAALPGKWPEADPPMAALLNANARLRPPAWTDVLVVRACLDDPALAAVGEAMARDLLTHARRSRSPEFEKLFDRHGQSVTPGRPQGLK